MAYIDKINKNSTDYDLQDSKAARSVDGTTASHVELTNQIFTESTQVNTGSFIFRTSAGELSIQSGDATIQYIDGNTVQTGHTDEVLNVTGTFSDLDTTVTIAASTWRAYVANDGTYEFSYDGTDWKLGGATVTLADYGLAVSGTVTTDDTITVSYVKLVIGSLTTATPTSFVATGFNQYDATAGYAHVVGGNQYRIDGTYTSLGFTTTVGGTTTPVTVTDSKFTPAEDGYIYVTGASGDILIALVWSGTMDSEPYSAYTTSTITIPTTDASSNNLPTATYGMPSVHGVADRLSFADKAYIQKIGHYTYSAENLATVEALGVDYWYDTSDIFYVLATPITYTLASSVSGVYTVNDYGTEEIIGTSVPMPADIVYGNSLVDKLRNLLPIQELGSGLSLVNSVLSAAGGGGIKTLTTADYNYPTTGTKTAVALWLLESGCYRKGPNTSIYYHSSGISDIGAGQLFVVSRSTSSTQVSILSLGTSAYNVYIVNEGSGVKLSTALFPYQGTVLTSSTIRDNLTSTDTNRPLSAKQGKVLNEYVGDLSTLTTTTKTSVVAAINELATGGQLSTAIINGGTTAPTTATVGAVGTLYSYVDTTGTPTAHLCVCTEIDTTDPDNPVYTWATSV